MEPRGLKVNMKQEGPCDAVCQLKSCQLLHSLRKITCEMLAVGNDFEGDSRLLQLRLFNRP